MSQKDCELENLYFRSDFKLLQPLVYLGKMNELLSYVECILKKKKRYSVQAQDIKNEYKKGVKRDCVRIRRFLLGRTGA